MRSVILISLSAFMAAVLGGYSILWYSQAISVKRSVEQAIARINEKKPYIAYESIKTSGFPEQLRVSIVNPRFQGRIDGLLNELQKDGAQAAGTPPGRPIPEWTEDIQLNGEITFGINAVSNRYTFAATGEWQQNSNIAGQILGGLHQYPGGISCFLEFEKRSGLFDTLWNFDLFDAATAEARLKDLRAFDCGSAGYAFLDAATKSPLYTGGPVRFYITNAPRPDSRHVRLYLKGADMEMTPEGDARMAIYAKALSGDHGAPLQMAVYGKQNLEFDFSYSGPDDLQASQTAPFDIALTRLDFSNQAESHHMEFQATRTPQPPSGAASLSWKTQSNFNASYDAIIRNVAYQFIKQMHASSDPQMQEIKAFTHAYTPEQLYAIAEPLIPQFHQLNKVVTSVNASFTGAPDFSAGDLTLSEFEMSAAPYGLTAKGTAKLAPSAMPTANLQITCNNCLKWIDDMADYATRLKKAVSYFDPAQAQTIVIDPAQTEAVKQFFIALAGAQMDAPPASLNYAVVGNGAEMTVNGKTLAEIMALYAQYIQPVLPPPPAPAAIPGEGVNP